MSRRCCRAESAETGSARPPRPPSSTTTLAPGALILEVQVPQPDASIYLKAMDRATFSFALVGVAAARFGNEIRLGLAGVAPVPWKLESIEELEGATPLPETAYKVE